MITLEVEPFSECIDEINKLGERHFKAVRGSWDKESVYSPNLAMYINLADLGVFQVICMRSHGVLVGYSGIILAPDHACVHKTMSHCALLFVREEYRGRNSLKLMKFTEKHAKAVGADYHIWSVKPEYDFSAYLERDGYALREVQYMKDLGG